MDFLIRLAQTHPSFRLAEIRSLATLLDIQLEVLWYSPSSPFLLVHIHAEPPSQFSSPTAAAEALISRSVLSAAIYELWGTTVALPDTAGQDPEPDHAQPRSITDPNPNPYNGLHTDIRARSDSNLWNSYVSSSFRFRVDSFGAKRSAQVQRDIINGFRYLGFQGPIVMDAPEQEFGVFENWAPAPSVVVDPQFDSVFFATKHPRELHFGRLIARSPRLLWMEKHSLKTRPYISTTSMDPVLALVTANLALVGPGKVVYDPFMGTGGFLLAGAELGGVVWGSDIDGRSFRGIGGSRGQKESKGCEEGLGRNLVQYGLQAGVGNCFVADLVNSPIGRGRNNKGWLDAVLADPPYGVREGLKVLGKRDGEKGEMRMVAGRPAHLNPGFIAPKRPYSFVRMLDDILEFAAGTLVDGGRLAFWMPSANEEEEGVPIPVPQHEALSLLECCEQPFNKWSRKLLVYERLERNGVNQGDKSLSQLVEDERGKTASELNPFRKKYFEKSKP